MGTWNATTFGNDDALDWLRAIADHDVESVTAALESINSRQSDEYLEANSCCVALAAAELVAALQGRPSQQLPEDAKKWLTKHTLNLNGDLCSSALMAVTRIAEESELKDLWAESGAPEEWTYSIKSLKDRLSTQ